MKPRRTPTEIVENTRAIRWWINRQIDKGRNDEEIAADLPLATLFITGRISEAELRAGMRRFRGNG